MNWNKQSEAEHPHRRPLMLPQEIARLAPTEQIILRPGMLPMKTSQARWYDDPHFSSWVRPPPEIPRLNVVVAEDDRQTVMPHGGAPLPVITAADVEPEVEEENV